MILLCDPCSKRHDHDHCAGSVRAFIEPDGPDWYVCECSCARLRRERREADRKVRAVVEAFERRYGREALLTLIGAHDTTEVMVRAGEMTCPRCNGSGVEHEGVIGSPPCLMCDGEPPHSAARGGET